jgi:hypothetical protein
MTLHKMTLQEINSAILYNEFTNDQLTSIVDAVRFARGQLTSKHVRTLVIGTTVKFKSIKLGTVIGTVQKVNRKFIMVRAGMTVWRVPANMLQAT